VRKGTGNISDRDRGAKKQEMQTRSKKAADERKWLSKPESQSGSTRRASNIGFGFGVASFGFQVRSCWHWASRTPRAPDVSGKRFSADWQSAVSPVGNRPAARSLESADYQSAKVANLRYELKPGNCRRVGD
jgi:hypothetical protein